MDATFYIVLKQYTKSLKHYKLNIKKYRGLIEPH
jgi:hypothetical protein